MQLIHHKCNNPTTQPNYPSQRELQFRTRSIIQNAPQKNCRINTANAKYFLEKALFNLTTSKPLLESRIKSSRNSGSQRGELQLVVLMWFLCLLGLLSDESHGGGAIIGSLGEQAPRCRISTSERRIRKRPTFLQKVI
ncbi:uncharacterized protein LOC129767733 [Toxorhynchites rutilus septentrionalis]|uniref:uncharacterized protein LOC129767733 n=1 Tax=Toxorhynchites rutilus septentrionalis TaxID=329112 RepID=UPI00247B0C82|nr:uncharacterized protein LOC129767733 [Toxorhynchites rutilus septentrionalis]XP_055624866.1 uncharacterized protein LOC129767733 [Toxorhynchites rutilus septentrionalis]